MTSGVAVHVPERYTRVFSYRYHRAAFMNPLSSAMFCLFSSSSVCVWRGGGGGGTRARAHASVRGATYNFGVIFRKEWSSLYSTWSWSTVLWHQTRRLIWLNLPTPKWWDFLPAASNIAWHAYITIHWCFCADTVISLLPPPPPSFFLSWHGRSTHHRRTLFIWIIQCHLMPQW